MIALEGEEEMQKISVFGTSNPQLLDTLIYLFGLNLALKNVWSTRIGHSGKFSNQLDFDGFVRLVTLRVFQKIRHEA